MIQKLWRVFPQFALAPLGVLGLSFIFEYSAMSWGPTLATPTLLLVIILLSFQSRALPSYLACAIAWMDVAFFIPAHLHMSLAPRELAARNILWFFILFTTVTAIQLLQRRLIRNVADKVRELERSKTSLLESELRTRGLIEFAFDAFIGTTGDGRITVWNLQAEKTFGWPREAVLGKHPEDFLVPSRYHARLEQGTTEFILAGESSLMNRRLKLEVLHRDGFEVPVEVTVYPVQQNDGFIFGAFLHDITERITNEQRLTELNQNLERLVDERTRELKHAFDQAEVANRLKDEFLAVVSHELRNPLGAILGSADLLLSESAPPHEQRALIEIIQRNATNQNRLINDLLDVSRVIAGKLDFQHGVIDLGALVGSVVESFQITARSKNIGIEIDLPVVAIEVNGDAARLQQVLWNLLSNALKFTPANGSVRIQVKAREAKVSVTVADSGRGIDPEFLPYVFESFRQEDATTTRRFGGLGLGLAIVRHIIESHGGHVEAASEGFDRGTQMTLTLPQISLEAAQHRPVTTATPLSRPSLQNVRVVCVDDSEDSLYLLRRFLEHAGAHVRTAESVHEAIALFESDPPDILISDISMPGEDGFELIRKIRARGEASGGRVPAIALTAHARDEELRRALHFGFDLHVAKPMKADHLLHQVHALLDRRSRPLA